MNDVFFKKFGWDIIVKLLKILSNVIEEREVLKLLKNIVMFLYFFIIVIFL